MYMSKWVLAELLFGKGCDNNRFTVNGVWFHIHSVQREDGSGSKFNVRTTYLGHQGKTEYRTFFITTGD